MMESLTSGRTTRSQSKRRKPMGFNTTIVIMNDALHQIGKDPEFGKNVAEAIMMRETYGDKLVDIPSGNHVNAASVIETHHADGMHAVLVGGNSGYNLGWVGGYSLNPSDSEHAKTLLKALADHLGYKIALTKKK
jgi:hypothetical protein